ncbi:hypothetical protein [Arthrobacter sp. ISL-72]|uniref:hypothetical protein n=1 Tax=Arthrobacter sp. ISL-72 TaxID=2819114 RepID=UPI001BECC362|nr:hypothetical protein [Arthrobacter sp. ISL-72]MBT2594272.1 hypothetical protein [Arthrobacter sp. ISL-72]
MTALRRIDFLAAGLATLPYLVLKLSWLAGATIGMEDEAAVATMGTPRFVVGNAVTAAMELIAIALAFVLTRPWGHRIPAWLVVTIGGCATGLLVPILIGLPLGLMLQLVSGAPPTAADDGGLAAWAFALVYSGFSVLAVALTTLLALYALQRWRVLLDEPPWRPSGWAAVVGALGLLPFGAAMTMWGAAGPGELGPRGLASLDQRVSLLVTGLLALAVFAAPYVRAPAIGAAHALWAVLWTGCACAALQGPAHLLLAEGAQIQPAVALLAALATPGATAYGLSILHARRRAVARVSTRSSLKTSLHRREEPSAASYTVRGGRRLSGQARWRAMLVSHV